MPILAYIINWCIKFRKQGKNCKKTLAREGIEPATSALLARRSNQLS